MTDTNRRIDDTIKLLKRHYRINVIFLAVLFFLAIFQLLPFFSEKQHVSIILDRYIIVITIIVIPAALKLFSNMLKKIEPGKGIDYSIEKYKNATYIRLYSLSALTLVHIMLYHYSGNMNFFWFTVVLLIVFIYCKPSFPELSRLINPDAIDESNQVHKDAEVEIEKEEE